MKFPPGTLSLSDNRKTKFRPDHFNTFGLMYGRPADGGTCPGATSGPGGCLYLKGGGKGRNRTCYVDNLVKIYPVFGEVLRRNTRKLRGKTRAQMRRVLDRTVRHFKHLNRKHPDKWYFRLSTSGDIFSLEYARAWADVMRAHPDVRFWTYTRSFKAVPILAACRNLSIYLSTDPVNYVEGSRVYEALKEAHPNVGIAFMGDRNAMPADRKWVTCPELSGKVVNSPDQGACAKCRLCFNWKEGVRLRSIQFPIH
jgi:Gene product 88